MPQQEGLICPILTLSTGLYTDSGDKTHYHPKTPVPPRLASASAFLQAATSLLQTDEE